MHHKIWILCNGTVKMELFRTCVVLNSGKLLFSIRHVVTIWIALFFATTYFCALTKYFMRAECDWLLNQCFVHTIKSVCCRALKVCCRKLSSDKNNSIPQLFLYQINKKTAEQKKNLQITFTFEHSMSTIISLNCEKFLWREKLQRIFLIQIFVPIATETSGIFGKVGLQN